MALNLRHHAALIVLLGGLTSASARTPPPNVSPDFFAGEWAGTGEYRSYCYVTLEANGQGLVLIDAGSGDWLGARVRWRNQQQTVVLEETVPLPVFARHRILPLNHIALTGGFNLSLSLSWRPEVAGCQLQKIETLASHLQRARGAVAGMSEDRQQ